MKKFLLFLMAFLMLFTTIVPSVSMAMGNDFHRGVEEEGPISNRWGENHWRDWGGEIKPMVIEPVDDTAIETYHFYTSKEEADAAAAGKPDAVAPFNTQRITRFDSLEEPDIRQKDEEMFVGWFYEDENVEHQVVFEKMMMPKAGAVHHVYPKFDEVIYVNFISGNTVLKKVDTVVKDGKHVVPSNAAPLISVKGQVVSGWGVGERFVSDEAASEANKLFQEEVTTFSESTNLYAIFEDAITITYDTLEGSYIPAQVLTNEGEKVQVPTFPTKQGYKAPEDPNKQWYILVEDEESPEEFTREYLKVNEGVFEKDFTKSDTIYPHYEPIEVTYNVIFMMEKEPSQYSFDHQGYEYMGSYSDANPSAGMLETTGKTGSELVLGDNGDLVEDSDLLKDIHFNPVEPTYISMDYFSSQTKLNKYAKAMGLPDKIFEGTHVNKTKSNEEHTYIEGDGNGFKIIYLDRDPVYVYYEGNKLPGNFRYGQNMLLFNPDDSINEDYGWGYIKTLTGNKNVAVDNSSGSELQFLYPPVLTNTGNLSKTSLNTNNPDYDYKDYDGNVDTDASYKWELKVRKAKETYGSGLLLGVPVVVPNTDEIFNGFSPSDVLYDANQERDLETLKTAHENALSYFNQEDKNITDYLLPNEEQALYGTISAKRTTYLTQEDVNDIKGFAPWEAVYVKNETRYYGTRLWKATNDEQYVKVREDILNHAYRQGVLRDFLKVKNKSFNYYLEYHKDNVEDNIFVSPFFYMRQKFSLTIENRSETKNFDGIPYDALVRDEAQNAVDYMRKYQKPDKDPYGNPLLNPEDENKTWIEANGTRYYFDGWYFDKAYHIEIDEETANTFRMPARNVQVFGKWEPLYHTVYVHRLPQDNRLTFNEENIETIKVKDGNTLNPNHHKLVYDLPQGKIDDDFNAWVSYGNATQEIPSVSGEGTEFIYDFKNKVDRSFHLFPSWEDSKARLLFIYNFNDAENGDYITNEDIQEVRNLLNNPEKHEKDDIYQLAQYFYTLDEEYRLASPIGVQDGQVVHIEAPEGTFVGDNNLIFDGWKMVYHSYSDLSKSFIPINDETYYHNTPFTIDKNNLSYETDASHGDTLGVLVFVAKWKAHEKTTTITYRSNGETYVQTVDPTDSIVNLIDLYAEDASQEIKALRVSGKQFMGWKDKLGNFYKNGAEVVADNRFFEEGYNELEAVWEDQIQIDLEKNWNGKKSDKLYVALLRRPFSEGEEFTGIDTLSGATVMKDSIKSIPDNGKVQWFVDGQDKEGSKYFYVTVELTEEMKDLVESGESIDWSDLNITLHEQQKEKTQLIEIVEGEKVVDAYTSSTIRKEKETGTGKGYTFTMLNDQIAIGEPIIKQPYAGDTEVSVKPPQNAKEMTVTIGEGSDDVKTIKLVKKDDGQWYEEDGITPLPEDKHGVKVDVGRELIVDEKITAQAKEENGQSSQKVTTTVLEKGELPGPPVDEIIEGDSTMNVEPDSGADIIEVKFPSGYKLILHKNTGGDWVDGNDNVIPTNEDGTVDVPIVGAPKEGTISTVQKNEASGAISSVTDREVQPDLTPRNCPSQPDDESDQGQPGRPTQQTTLGGNLSILFPSASDPKPKTIEDRHIKYIFGYPDGSFGPERHITRGEAAMILARIISGKNEFAMTNTQYPDVTNEMWHSGAIEYLSDKDILTGYEDGLFRPDDPISRAEFTTIIARYKQLHGNACSDFSDIDDHWAYQFICGVFDAGYISGYPDGTFKPDQEITRAEAVKIVNEMLERYGDLEYILANIQASMRFNDVPQDHWAFTHIYEAAWSHDFTRVVDERAENWKSLLERE